MNGQIGCAAPKWDAVLTLLYSGETKDLVGGRDTEQNSFSPNPTGRIRDVDSYLELGLRGCYLVTDTTEISGGVINHTDEEPPISELAGSGGWPFFNQAL